MIREWKNHDVCRMHIGSLALIQVAGHNLGLLMRKLFGVGKPRTLRRAGGLVFALTWLYWRSAAQLGRWNDRRISAVALPA